MNSTGVEPTIPAPQSAETPSPAPPSPGTVRDMLLFLMAAVVLFPAVQIAAVNLLAWLARPRHPGLDWGRLLEQVVQENQYNAFFAVPLQAAYYVLILGLLYYMIRVHRGVPFAASLRLRTLPHAQAAQGLAIGFLLALLINFLNVIVPPPEPLAFDKLFSSRAAALLVITASLVMAPLVEEIIFRGYIYSVVERSWGLAPAVLASGILFGSIHFPQLWPGYFQMVLLCVVGIVFSLARAYTGTTLASIVLHFGYNFAISALYLISPTFRALPAADWILHLFH